MYTTCMIKNTFQGPRLKVQRERIDVTENKALTRHNHQFIVENDPERAAKVGRFLFCVEGNTSL